MGLQLGLGTERDQDAEGDQAAVARGEALTAPQRAPHGGQADLDEILAELAVPHVEITLRGNHPGQCGPQGQARDAQIGGFLDVFGAHARLPVQAIAFVPSES